MSLLGTVPLGGLTDRYGPQRVWIVGLVLDAALFATYPFVGGFAGFLAVVVALAAVDAATGVARQVYSINVLRPEERVTAMAYQRSSLNVGFGLGAVISGLVLAVDTIGAYRGMVWFIRGLPGDGRLRAAAAPAAAGGPPGGADEPARGAAGPAVHGGVLLSGLLTAHQTLYLTVMPLWILTHTDAPKTIIAALVLLNTVLIVLLQVRVSRGADTAAGAARASRRGAPADRPVLSGPADFRADPGRAHVVVLVAAATVLILAELIESAGAWGLTATLPPADQRGAYVGAFGLGSQVQYLIAPAGLTALGVTTGGWGWLPAAAIFVLVGLAIVPAVAWAGADTAAGCRGAAAAGP